MNQFIRPVQITAEAHLIQSFWKQHGAPVGVHINTMVLASREPVVFDTGVSADRDGWLGAVSSVVDPDDVRWIVLSHDDHDHTGNLEAALEHFPNAIVVASWWMTERLTGSIELDPRRMHWVVSGDTLDIGDRTLVFQRPRSSTAPPLAPYSTRAPACSGPATSAPHSALRQSSTPTRCPPTISPRALSSPTGGSPRGSRWSTTPSTKPK